MLDRVFRILVKIVALVHNMGIRSNVAALQVMKENYVKQVRKGGFNETDLTLPPDMS